MKQNKKKFLFCNCPCASDSPVFRNIMIFYLKLFNKAIKIALKVIDMNKPAPNLQLGLGTNQTKQCHQTRTVSRNQIKDSSTHRLPISVLIFLQLRLMANG